MKNVLKSSRLLLAVSLSLFAYGSAFGQGVRYDNILLNARGNPISGTTVAVCQNTGLATTAASVTSNMVTLTMASDPSAAGFVIGGNIAVSGFTGADTYLNSSFVLTGVTTSQLKFALTHANASATSNGAVTQTVGASATCAPWVTIYADSALAVPTINPFTTDGMGNYGFWTAPGIYKVSFNGGNTTPTAGTVTIPCVPNSVCPLLSGISTINPGTLAGPTVTFQTGAAGTDFNLSGAANTLTLNLPTASSTARGLLSTANWSTFNGKQAAISVTAPITLVGATIGIDNLPVTKLNSGTGAGNTTFWRGDGTWNPVNLSGVAVSGTPSAGQRLTATSPSAATWSSTVGGISYFNCFFPGALTSTWEGCWIQPGPGTVTVTRVTAAAKTNAAGCTTAAVVGVAGPASITLSIANATTNNDTGSISTSLTSPFQISIITAASGCTTAPADLNVVVQWQ